MKQLEGNRGRRPLNEAEPQPPDGMPEPPRWFGALARQEWRRITRVLDRMEMLKATDYAALVAYCQSWARWCEAEQRIEREGITTELGPGEWRTHPVVKQAMERLAAMRLLAAEFGFTPASRTRVRLESAAGPVDAMDRLERILNGPSERSGQSDPTVQ